MSEFDDIDAMIDRMAREEKDDIDRNQGQFLLDVIAAEEHRKQTGEHPILEAINRAHQAKAEADKE